MSWHNISDEGVAVVNEVTPMVLKGLELTNGGNSYDTKKRKGTWFTEFATDVIRAILKEPEPSGKVIRCCGRTWEEVSKYEFLAAVAGCKETPTGVWLDGTTDVGIKYKRRYFLPTSEDVEDFCGTYIEEVSGW